jgi:hypothetical protein
LLLLGVGLGSTLLGLWFPERYRPYSVAVDFQAYRIASKRLLAGVFGAEVFRRHRPPPSTGESNGTTVVVG